MPRVLKEAFTSVHYRLQCDYKRAEALAQDLCRLLKDDPGLRSAEDVTNGWDRHARVQVDYDTFEDAIRLDAKVRELLGRKVDYTYEAHAGVSYGNKGGYLTVTASTQLREI